MITIRMTIKNCRWLHMLRTEGISHERDGDVVTVRADEADMPDLVRRADASWPSPLAALVARLYWAGGEKGRAPAHYCRSVARVDTEVIHAA